MGKHTQGVYGSWELSSLLSGESAVWWKTEFTKIFSTHSRDWTQREYKYELFPPFLHHYKSCFHSVPRQMDLGSKGQKQPPVKRSSAKRRGCVSLSAQGKPSPGELGNHPWQPRFRAAPVEGGWAKLSWIRHPPPVPGMNLNMNPVQKSLYPPSSSLPRKALYNPKSAQLHLLPLLALQHHLCCWPGTLLWHRRARLGTNH